MSDPRCTVTACPDQPFIEHPLTLCRKHALMVSLNVSDSLHATALAGHAGPGLDVDRVSVAPTSVWKQTSHPSVVYFLANGDRVKIGVSTNVAARVGALSLRKDNAALLLQGEHDLENALHEHFASDRIGRTEWFAFSVRIQDYIDRCKKADAALRQPSMPETPAIAPRVSVAVVSRPPTPTADEKILKVLEDAGAPFDLQVTYLHKDQVGDLSKVESSTLDNTLSRLVKTGRIHRQVRRGRTIRGMYGLGAVPRSDAIGGIPA